MKNPSVPPLVRRQKHWFNGHMSSAPTQYLAVVFTAEFLSAVLWQYLDGKITILTQSKNVPVKSWKMGDINAAVDVALDELGEAGLTIKHVLFGVPNSWLENNSLQSEKKHILKALTQDLLLEPLGYVVNSDALAAAQRDKTGQPFSGSFLSTTKHFIEAERYERGNLVQAERVGRSGEISQDVAEFLARFPEVKKDARCILVGGNEHEELESALSAQRSSPLEHLATEQAVKAIVQAGGAETLQASGVPNTPSAPAQQETPVTAEDSNVEMIEAAATDEEGGFTLPSFLQAETTPADNHVDEPKHDGPLMNTPRFVVHGSHDPSALAESSVEAEIEEVETVAPPVFTAKKKPFKFPAFTLPKMPGKKGAVPLIIGVVLLLLAGSGAAAYFSLQNSTKAVVSVWIQSETLKQSQSFLIRTSAAPANASQSSIIAESFTETVTIDKEVPTTGTKIIGDLAKGKVKVFNRTSQEKMFPQGTKITVGKYTFSFDEEVKVASASSGSDYSVIPGTKDVNVTAAAIGPESNLAKDQEFKIANFDTSSYVAKNSEPFAGGTSREIQAVAKKDVDSAASDLLKAATTQLKEKIEAQSSEESPVLFGQQVKITKTDTSAKIGDEQKFVTVTLNVEGQGLKIPKAELERVAAEAFKDKLQPGQQIQPGKISITTESISGGLNDLRLQAGISAQVLPDVPASVLRDKIVGQYVPRAETLLKEQTGVARIEIKFVPAWMEPFMRSLPKDPQKIEFNMRIQEET
jgi:hypothetical protein